MASVDELPSSPVSSGLASPVNTTHIGPEHDITKYHSHLDSIHAKMYRYNSFETLLSYLNNTLLARSPYIDYPSDEILTMILTGTQLNHIEDKGNEKLLNISVACLEYINSLFEVYNRASTISVFDDPAHFFIFDAELTNLHERLDRLFSFLKPSMISKRNTRKKNSTSSHHILPVEDTTLDYSIEENIDFVDNELRNDKMQSLFEISTTSDKFQDVNTFFGVKYLHETEKKLWNYFIFAFNTASKLSEIERIDSYESYVETWNRWREFLNILLQFMELELQRSTNINNSLFATNLINLSGCTDISYATQDQYLDSLLTFIEYLFSSVKSNIEISSIIPIDLTLNQKYIFSCNPYMLENKYRSSGIGLDSIPTRSRLLRLCWRYLLRFPIDMKVKTKFCDSVAKSLFRLKPRELLAFFSDGSLFLDSKTVIEDILFIVSFEIMRFLSRCWTMTSQNFLDDYKVYLKQLKLLFETTTKNLNTGFNSFDDSNIQTEILVQVSSNDDLEKCFILAKYQLQIVTKSINLTDEEWRIIDSIVFKINGKSLSMGNIIRKK